LSSVKLPNLTYVFTGYAVVPSADQPTNVVHHLRLRL